MPDELPNSPKPAPPFATAYYLNPPVWVNGPPGGNNAPSEWWAGAQLSLSPSDLEKLADEVYRKDLRCGISVAVLREGKFVFDFSKWSANQEVPGTPPAVSPIQGALERTAVLNTHLACLYTAIAALQGHGILKMVLSPGDLFSTEFSPPYLGGGMPGNDLHLTWLAMSRVLGTYSQNMPLGLDFRMISRHTVLWTSTIERSFELFEKALENKAPRIVTVADIYLRSCRACEEHNYGLSTVLAWAACEKLLNVLWERYINERNREDSGSDMKLINSNRKGKLMGADFTASIITEILSLADRIDFRLYENLNRVRKARNNWVHDLVSEITFEVTLLALQVTGDMMELVDAIPIRLAPSPMGVPGFAPLPRAR